MKTKGILPSTVNGRTVKNLGWLLRHWKEVKSFTIEPHPPSDTIAECVLVATLKNGAGEYRTGFACKDILRDWLNRPVFRGLPQTWNI